MVLIEWKPELNIGVPSLDAQHQNLANMVNDLCLAMEAQKDRAVIEEDFQTFLLYTVQHFQYEERLLVEAGYDEADAHKKEHDELQAEVMELKQKFDDNKTGSVAMDILAYLRNWLLQHIEESDRKFVPHLLANGIK